MIWQVQATTAGVVAAWHEDDNRSKHPLLGRDGILVI